MKQLTILCPILSFFILASCSNKEEPDYPVYMQLSSIRSLDVNANNQTFEYDDKGRIVSWSCTSNSPNNPSSYLAHYSYPDENTIKVSATEEWLNQQRLFKEIINLKNGKASRSEGEFIYSENGNHLLRKTYRLLFDYLASDHLSTVEHLEVVGIGDEIKENAWDNAWRWINYLIWEKGNLTEFKDYHGNSSYQLTKYEYSEKRVSNPVIIPMVINSAHHFPLCMQGVFGLNSGNLVETASTFDIHNKLNFSQQYSYEVVQDRISRYTETIYANSAFSNPVTYTVNWTETK